MTIEKTRRCFVWQNQIWQLDIYRYLSHVCDQCNCKSMLYKYTPLSLLDKLNLHRNQPFRSPHPGLMLLETYTALPTNQLVMPDFLTVKREVTGESRYNKAEGRDIVLIKP